MNNTLLAVDEETNKVKVNLDRTVRLLVRESDCLIKMELELPVVCQALYAKRDYFVLINDTLQSVVEEFVSVVRAVKIEVRPLLLPQVARLAALLRPGLERKGAWAGAGWRAFANRAHSAIDGFGALVARVHDVYCNRVLLVIATMRDVCPHSLPGSWF